jgi:hypothetical protein
MKGERTTIQAWLGIQWNVLCHLYRAFSYILYINQQIALSKTQLNTNHITQFM